MKNIYFYFIIIFVCLTAQYASQTLAVNTVNYTIDHFENFHDQGHVSGFVGINRAHGGSISHAIGELKATMQARGTWQEEFFPLLHHFRIWAARLGLSNRMDVKFFLDKGFVSLGFKDVKWAASRLDIHLVDDLKSTSLNALLRPFLKAVIDSIEIPEAQKIMIGGLNELGSRSTFACWDHQTQTCSLLIYGRERFELPHGQFTFNKDSLGNYSSRTPTSDYLLDYLEFHPRRYDVLQVLNTTAHIALALNLEDSKTLLPESGEYRSFTVTDAGYHSLIRIDGDKQNFTNQNGEYVFNGNLTMTVSLFDGHEFIFPIQVDEPIDMVKFVEDLITSLEDFYFYKDVKLLAPFFDNNEQAALMAINLDQFRRDITHLLSDINIKQMSQLGSNLEGEQKLLPIIQLAPILKDAQEKLYRYRSPNFASGSH